MAMRCWVGDLGSWRQEIKTGNVQQAMCCLETKTSMRVFTESVWRSGLSEIVTSIGFIVTLPPPSLLQKQTDIVQLQLKTRNDNILMPLNFSILFFFSVVLLECGWLYSGYCCRGHVGRTG